MTRLSRLAIILAWSLALGALIGLVISLFRSSSANVLDSVYYDSRIFLALGLSLLFAILSWRGDGR